MKSRVGVATAAVVLVSSGMLGCWLWSATSESPLPSPAPVEGDIRPAPRVFHTDGGGRPSTISEMLQRADSVVLARMVSDQTDEVRVGASRVGLYYTGFRFLVIEQVTGPLREGDIITVWRLGQREDTEEFYLRPTLGQIFVVCLNRFPHAVGYYPAFGRYGTYEVLDGQLRQLVSHPTTASFEGKPVEVFLRALRRQARGE